MANSSQSAILATNCAQLKGRALAFSGAYLAQKQSANALRLEIITAGSDLEARQRALDKYKSDWNKQYADLNRASDDLTAAARELLLKIMDVSERQ
jgi:hypothetical protein